MRHLFKSVAQVLEPSTTVEKGAIASSGWQPVMEMFDPAYGKLSYLKCRLDLQFIRPGKDVAPAVNAIPIGRQGLLFCSLTPFLKAGQRLKMVAGPIRGMFTIEIIPEEALGYSNAHHIEVQVFEVAQNRMQGTFPGREPTGGLVRRA